MPVLDILARTRTIPPQPGDHDVTVAFGPGFTMSALRGVWQD